MEDSLTILTTSDEYGAPKGILTKKVTLTPDGISVSGFSQAKIFTSRSITVTDIYSLGDVLNGLSRDFHSAVIRGEKLEGVQPVHRRLYAPGRENRTYQEKPRYWICLDVDKLDLALIGAEPDEWPTRTAHRIIEKFLPACFNGVSFYAQLSCSHGYKPLPVPAISLHLWFWMSEPVNDGDAKRMVEQFNLGARVEYHIERPVFDVALFNPIQLHYTADPVLGEDVEETRYKRRWLYTSDSGVVDVSRLLDRDRKPGGWSRHTRDVGSDKDGFHLPLLRATAAYVREHGEPSSQALIALKDGLRQAIDSAVKGPQHGPEVIARYRSDAYLDMLVEGAINRGFSKTGDDELVKEAVERFGWCNGSEAYFDRQTGRLLSAEGVHMALRTAKQITKFAAFRDAVQQADMVQCLPGQPLGTLVDNRGMIIWSSWRGRPHNPTYGDVSWLTEHVAYLCDHDPATTKIVLDYLAFILNNPGKKVMWALVLCSEKQGTGKSFIGRMLNKLIADVRNVDQSILNEKFTDFIFESELVSCEEVKISHKRETILDRLKSFITEPRVPCRRFLRRPEDVDIYCNFIMFTNHRDALPLNDGDRRYAIVISEASPKQQSYYHELQAQMEAGLSNVMGWAERRDLTQFDRFAAPDTVAHKAAMAEMALPTSHQNILEALRARSYPFEKDVILTTDLVQPFQDTFRTALRRPELERLVTLAGGTFAAEKNCTIKDRRTKKNFILLGPDQEVRNGRWTGEQLYAESQGLTLADLEVTPPGVRFDE